MAGLPGPVRTCVGCRARATKATLLRVVAVEGALVPDPDARLPGRGASVHLDLGCLALADKRRAFTRALRLEAPVDSIAVQEHVRTTAQPRADQPDQHDQNRSTDH